MVFQFTIPSNPSELFSTGKNNYIVSHQYDAKEIPALLKNARDALMSEGVFFIFSHFDTFFAVFNETATQLGPIHCLRANDLLYLTLDKLGKHLSKLLEESTLDTDNRIEVLNAAKMTVYLMINTIKKIDKNVKTILNARLVKKSARKQDAPEDYEAWEEKRTLCLIQLYNFVKLPLEKLWDPPVVEESFVTLFCEVAYRTLEHPSIKSVSIINTVFQILGYAIKRYNHGISFPVYLVQIIESCENAISPIANGIKILYEEFGITTIFSALIESLVDKLSADETDPHKSKLFSQFLTEMTSVAPNLILPHILKLSENLMNAESYLLRNCALQLMGNALIDSLTSENLTDEMRETRDEFLDNLLDNMKDLSAHVRSKVCQIWKMLQMENAIPLVWQHKVLMAAYKNMDDKSSIVRKNAIALIRVYLEHNPFGAKLSIEQLTTLCTEEEIKLQNMRDKKKDNQDEYEQFNLEWENNLKNDVTKVIEKYFLENKTNYPSIPGQDGQNKVDEIEAAILVALKETEINFEAVVTLLHEADDAIDNRKDRELLPMPARICYFLTLFNQYYMRSKDMPDYDADMGKIEKTIQFYSNNIEFSETIVKCLKKMELLLTSKTTSDIMEAVDFFTTSYLFGIENTKFGVRRMLNLVWSNETIKRELVAAAYKRILFDTEAANTTDHRLCSVNTVKKLLLFLTDLDSSEHMAIEVLFSEWVKTGIITNSMINVMFEIYTMKIENTTLKESFLAQQLLILCAVQNPTIVKTNKELLIKIGLEERAAECPAIFMGTLELLKFLVPHNSSVRYYQRLDVENDMIQSIRNIYIKFFFAADTSENFDDLTIKTFSFFYRMCLKPDGIAKDLLYYLYERLKTTAASLLNTPEPEAPVTDDIPNSQDEMPPSQFSQGLPPDLMTQNPIEDFHCLPVPLLSKFIFLLGYVGIKEMINLDIDVYSNLKYLEELKVELQLNKKNAKLNNKRLTLLKNSLNYSASSALKRKSLGPGPQSKPEDETQETEEDIFGTTDDDIAELIALICEREMLLDKECLLYKFLPLIKDICSQPKRHNNAQLNQAAVLTLIRFMTISSIYCDVNMPFLMNIFRETNNVVIKTNIVIGLSDFTFRFPNVMEPWTNHFYNTLKSRNNELRLTALKILSNLILNEMIRVRAQISDMALCLVDEDPQIKNSTEQFFFEIANKANILYNALPDIISNLSSPPAIEKEKYRIIMKYIMSLIQKDRQIEGLVEKLCSRLRASVDERQWCDWAFCLSLLQYNERTLKKLMEHIDCFKDKVQVDEVYDSFKLIVTNSNKFAKPEMKLLVKEFETRLADCLAINDDNEMDNDNSRKQQSLEKNTKTGKKKRQPPAKVRGKKPQKVVDSSSESVSSSDSEDDSENQPPRRAAPKTPISKTPAARIMNGRTPAARTSSRTPAPRSTRKNTVAKKTTIIETSSSSDDIERPQPKRRSNKRSV